MWDLDLKLSVLEDEEECGGGGEHKYCGGGGRGIDQKVEAVERATVEANEADNKKVCKGKCDSINKALASS